MPQISIVIPVFNQSHFTRRCLRCLLDHSEQAREIAVIDNHSTDDTAAVLRELQPEFEKRGWKFHILTNGENRGFGRACNQGIRATQGDYVVILNNDTWLMPGWDRALAGALEKLGAAMVGPYYYEKGFDEKSLRARARRFTWLNRGKSREFWVPMLMFFRRAALDQVGIFDERYFVSFEEIDLRVRFDRAGLKYYMVGDCLIWHAVKGTRGDAKLVPSSHELEGRKLFIEKWNFDPDDLRPGYHRWPARLKRRWQRIKNSLDLF
ncbi:MAG: glycosyltransferase family 2 protein [Oligoflexia bacterium]|nr:glycosyltransferase family 2 protein [Oligoflexia bacterium]